MKFKYIVGAVVCLFSAYSWGSIDYEPAELLANKNSKRSLLLTSGRGGREGWALFNYIVTKEGRVIEPLVLDYSGDEYYLRKARKYLTKLEFKAASYQGQAIATSTSGLIYHGMRLSRKDNRLAGKQFIEQYELTQKSMAGGELELAGQQLNELRNNYTKNLAEQAWFAWLSSTYAYLAEQHFDFVRESRVSTYLAYRRLTNQTLGKAYLNLYHGQMFLGHYKGAMQTLDRLQKSGRIQLSESDRSKLWQAAESQLNSSQITVSKYKFYKNSYVQHSVHRPVIKLLSDTTSILDIQLRCPNNMQRITLTTGNRIDAGENYEQCELLMLGEEGNKVVLQEEG